MKTKIGLPIIILAFGFTAFNTSNSFSAKINEGFTNKALNADEYCAMYAVTSVTRNGQEENIDHGKYLFYFCSGNVLSVQAGTEVYQGTWSEIEKGVLAISISTADPDLEWLDGTWQVMERSDWTLELQKTEAGDNWYVRFEGRQR